MDLRGLIYDRGDGLLEQDLTFGIKPSERSILIVQLQTGVPSDDVPYARLAPSFIYEASPGRHIEIGATAGIVNSDAVRVKVGLWLRF